MQRAAALESVNLVLLQVEKQIHLQQHPMHEMLVLK